MDLRGETVFVGLETVFVGPVTGFARLKIGFAELIQPFFGAQDKI